MTEFDLALCRSVTALTGPWLTRRVASPEKLKSASDTMPEELLAQHEEDMAECRQEVRIMTSR